MSDVPPRQPISGADSVQINTSEGLPHYPDGTAQTPHFEHQGQSFVALRNQATAGDAYNILKAFQDYMELERQRAQKRTMIIAATFALILLMVLAGFFFIWSSSMHNMQGTQNALMNAALSGNKIHEIINTPPPKILESAPAIDIESVVAEAIKKSKESESESEDKALLAAQKAQHEQNKALVLMIEKMTETLNEVKKDNEELRARVNKAESQKTVIPPQSKKAPNAVEKKAESASPASTQPKQTLQPGPKNKPAAPKQKTDTKQPVATKNGNSKGQTGIFTESPKINIKRKEPPKGFEASSVSIPIGDDGSEKLNWRIYFPNEAR